MRPWLFVFLIACSSDPMMAPADAAIDALVTSEGGAPDAPSQDSGASKDDILGTFGMGVCPLVSADLTSPTPSIHEDALIFTMGEKFDKSSLSPGGKILFDTPNAGGSSRESEVMSFEILHFCEGAKLVKTETEIQYQPPDDSGPNSITDILVEIGGKKVGVSVTRGFKPKPQPYTVMDAKTLLESKLAGINRSSMRVLPADKWVKQILHVLVPDKEARDAWIQAYPMVDAKLRADTIVLLTQTTGGGFIYCNPDPPLGSECPPI